MPPALYQVAVTIILLVGGLLVCFLGYRLLWMVLGVYGFVFGGMLANSFLGAGTWQTVFGVFGGGLLGALAFLGAYYLGVALLGAALGALVVNLGWSQVGGEPHWVVVSGAAVAGAFAALAVRRYVIIVGTSFGGAWTALVGAFALLGDSAALAAASGDVWEVYPLTLVGQRGFAIAWFGLAFLASVVQFAVTSRARTKKKG